MKIKIEGLGLALAAAGSLAAAWLGDAGHGLAWAPLCAGFVIGSGRPSGGSALLDAAVAGDWKFVERLLDAYGRAKLDVAAEACEVLALAAACRSLDFSPSLVEKLLSAGADPDGWGEGPEDPNFEPDIGNPLYQLTMNLSEAAFEEVDDLEFRRKESFALDFAVRLLRAGADPNARFSGGRSLIAQAAAHSSKMARLLLEAGADPNPGRAPAYGGASPLHLACCHLPNPERIDYVETIEALVAFGADLSDGNDEGDTPLHWATAMGALAEVEALLAAGADFSARNAKGNTPEGIAEGPVKGLFAEARRRAQYSSRFGPGQ